jgi:citrate lyase gamma subunit
MRFWSALCCLMFLVCPLVGHADPSYRFVETLPTGIIDWTKGVVRAMGSIIPGSVELNGDVEDQVVVQARRAAVRNAMQALQLVRMEADFLVSDRMAADDKIHARVEEMVAAAPVVDEVRLSDGTVVVTIELALLGSFAQMMLPEDIKQVESVRALQSVTQTGARAGDPAPEGSIFDDPGVFSGLIVDARGINAKPAMAPLLMDENGRQVYGSTFISREYAVQHGVCAYVRALADPSDNSRVAPKPLWVKGLRTLPDSNSDIVISNADAARLRGASENLAFLRQCRVIIILD